MTKVKTRHIILCFVAYYLPGYRAGGPVRTIANFVDHLGDEFDIRIVTRDRDALDTAPYHGIVIDGWNTVGKAQVFYASPRTLTLRGVARLLRETSHDVLYLNSFFAFAFTGLPLLARRFGLVPRTPCVIAPRGEFSAGAIALKATKKCAYIFLSKALGLCNDLHWQASSAFEADDIRREFGDKAKVIDVAPDLPPKFEVTDTQFVGSPSKQSGLLRIIFLSRISPKKNLDYLLRVLHSVSKPVDLAIYGPVEREDYWALCQSLINKLPENISVAYQGEVTPDQVHSVFSAHDLFVLPTRGENFGHVILESLAVGTPVLISDQTPWQADGNRGVTTLSLTDLQVWSQEIMAWAGIDDAIFSLRREAALKVAQKYLNNAQVIDQNKNLFNSVNGINALGFAKCAE